MNIFPSNPFKAMAEGQMLQVIVFALLVGFALTRAGDAGERIANWFRDMEVIVMKMVGILIELAPYGVFALLTKLFATMGFGTIVDLAAYFFTLLGVLLFHGLVVYTSLLRTLTGLSPCGAVAENAPGLGLCVLDRILRCHAADHPAHGGEAPGCE